MSVSYPGSRPHLDHFDHTRHPLISASLIGRSGSNAFRLSTGIVSMSLTGSCFLRNRHRGPSSMGFEDEVEQSFRRPCRQTNGRSFFHPAAPGDLHRPGLEPGPFRRTHQHALGRFTELIRIISSPHRDIALGGQVAQLGAGGYPPVDKISGLLACSCGHTSYVKFVNDLRVALHRAVQSSA